MVGLDCGKKNENHEKMCVNYSQTITFECLFAFNFAECLKKVLGYK